MNKIKTILNKLSTEELIELARTDYTNSAIVEILEKTKSKNCKIRVGDCFVMKEENGVRVIKVRNIAGQVFHCHEAFKLDDYIEGDSYRRMFPSDFSGLSQVGPQLYDDLRELAVRHYEEHKGITEKYCDEFDSLVNSYM